MTTSECDIISAVERERKILEFGRVVFSGANWNGKTIDEMSRQEQEALSIALTGSGLE